MTVKSCSHQPHTSRIIFDVGNNQTTTYELCKNCQNLKVFSENILEIIEVNH